MKLLVKTLVKGAQMLRVGNVFCGYLVFAVFYNVLVPFQVKAQIFRSQSINGNVDSTPAVSLWVEPEDPTTADTIFVKLRINGNLNDKVIKGGAKSVELKLPAGLSQQSARTVTEGTSHIRTNTHVDGWSRIVRTYYIEAEKPGTYLIPPVEVSLVGQKFRTQPRKITVAKPELSAKKPDVSGKQYFALLESPKLIDSQRSIYVGEQIPVRLQFWSERNIRDLNMELPQISGIETVEISGELKVEKREKDGRELYVVERQYLLIAQKSGVFKMPRVGIVASVEGDRPKATPNTRRGPWDFFGGVFRSLPQMKRVGASVPASILKVKELPSPKPAGFSGLVGKVELKLSGVLPQELAAGETTDFSVSLVGDAYSRGIEDLNTSWGKGLEVFTAQGKDASYFSDEGQWVLEQEFGFSLGSEWGEAYSLGVLSIEYFDTAEERYRTAKLDLGKLLVKGPQKPREDTVKSASQVAANKGSSGVLENVAQTPDSLLSKSEFVEFLNLQTAKSTVIFLAVVLFFAMGFFFYSLWLYRVLMGLVNRSYATPRVRWNRSHKEFSEDMDAYIQSERSDADKLELLFQRFKKFVSDGTGDSSVVASTSSELSEKISSYFKGHLSEKELAIWQQQFGQCAKLIYGDAEDKSDAGGNVYSKLSSGLRSAASKLQSVAVKMVVLLLFVLSSTPGDAAAAGEASTAKTSPTEQKQEIYKQSPFVRLLPSTAAYLDVIGEHNGLEPAGSKNLVLVLWFVAFMVFLFFVGFFAQKKWMPSWVVAVGLCLWLLCIWVFVSEYAYQKTAVVLSATQKAYVSPHSFVGLGEGSKKGSKESSNTPKVSKKAIALGAGGVLYPRLVQSGWLLAWVESEDRLLWLRFEGAKKDD